MTSAYTDICPLSNNYQDVELVILLGYLSLETLTWLIAPKSYFPSAWLQ